MPILGWEWGQAGAVRAGDKVIPWGGVKPQRGLGMGSKTMVSCLGWLFVCVTIYLIPQLYSALVGGLPQILADTIVLSAPFPILVLLSQVKAFVGGTVQRYSLSLYFWLSAAV